MEPEPGLQRRCDGGGKVDEAQETRGEGNQQHQFDSLDPEYKGTRRGRADEVGRQPEEMFKAYTGHSGLGEWRGMLRDN